MDTALDDADEEVVFSHRQGVGTKEDWAYEAVPRYKILSLPVARHIQDLREDFER
ncbi:hypothetical protein PTI98_012307 [Pleurotus ostreatus]|nr:hypothetical protein PTI98_012307 [Pleurotus ostreatus]